MAESYSAAELERRRAAARRFAWLLGAGVLAIYLLGLSIQR